MEHNHPITDINFSFVSKLSNELKIQLAILGNKLSLKNLSSANLNLQFRIQQCTFRLGIVLEMDESENLKRISIYVHDVFETYTFANINVAHNFLKAIDNIIDEISDNAYTDPNNKSLDFIHTDFFEESDCTTKLYNQFREISYVRECINIPFLSP